MIVCLLSLGVVVVTQQIHFLFAERISECSGVFRKAITMKCIVSIIINDTYFERINF